MSSSVQDQRIDLPKYKRVNSQQRALIRLLRAQDKTEQEIADVIGVHQSTVSRWLREMVPLGDTRELAKQIAHTRAAEVTEVAFDAAIVAARQGNAEPALELVDRLDVAAKRRDEASRTGVQVFVNMPGQSEVSAPVINLLSPPVSSVIHSLTDADEANRV